MPRSQLPAFDTQTAIGRKVNHLLGRKSVGPIGFELSAHQVCAVQLQYRNSRAQVIAAVSEPLPCPREDLLANPFLLRSLIRRVLSKGHFVGREVVTCANSEQVKLSSHDYDVSDGKSDDQHIVELVRQFNSTPLDQLIIDYIPARRSDHKSDRRSALVAVANREEQLAYLETLRKGGLNVLKLEIAPIAIHRLIKRIALSQATPNIAVINVSEEKTHFTVISGRRLLLDRAVNFGNKELLHRLSVALEVDIDEAESLMVRYGFSTANPNGPVLRGLIRADDFCQAIGEVLKPQFTRLAQEFERVSAFVHGQLQGASVQRVFLLGKPTRWSGMDEFISELLDTEVENLDPLSSFKDTSDPDVLADVKTSSPLALATGCALTEVEVDE